MKEITTLELNELLNSENVFVVDFYTKWCGPCKLISPYLENVSMKISEINFFKFDAEQDKDLIESFNIKSVPTIILFKNSKEVSRKVGFLTEKNLFDWIIEKK